MKFYPYKKIMCVLLSTFILTAVIPDSHLVYAKTVKELQAERKELSKKTEEALAAIDDLKDKKLSLEEELNTMDQAMNSIQAELDKAEADLAAITASLEQCQKDLQEATKKRDDQFELLGKRMKYLQQKGAAGYLEILLDAQSFSDLFLRMQYVNDIMAYYKQMLDELQEIQNTISEKKTQIEEEKAAQEEIDADNNEKMASMQEVVNEKKALIASYENDVDKYEQLVEANKKADQAV